MRHDRPAQRFIQQHGDDDRAAEFLGAFQHLAQSIHGAVLAGQEYSLLYKVDGSEDNGRVSYEIGAPKTMYRKLIVESATLPVGTYYMEYVIYDVFMRPMKLERVELYWDGERMTIPNAAWEGRETLSVKDYYDSE